MCGRNLEVETTPTIIQDLWKCPEWGEVEGYSTNNAYRQKRDHNFRQKTDVLASQVYSTATLLGYKSQVSHYITLNDFLNLL